MAIPEALNPKVAIQGNAGWKLQKSSGSFNPETGYEEHRFYTGTRAAILGLFNVFALDGWISTWDHDGPHYQMTAQYIEPFVADRWERVVEWAQVSILQTPGLFGAGSVEQLAQWNAAVDFELDHMGSLTSAEATAQLGRISAFAAGQQVLYRLKARGMTSFEIKRYVLRLRRVIRATDIANADLADASETVYSTRALIDTFFVPAIIAAKLPSAPATVPADLQWGWRTRTDDVETNLVYNKAQMTKEWVFEAVPTTHYTFVG